MASKKQNRSVKQHHHQQQAKKQYKRQHQQLKHELAQSMPLALDQSTSEMCGTSFDVVQHQHQQQHQQQVYHQQPGHHTNEYSRDSDVWKSLLNNNSTSSHTDDADDDYFSNSYSNSSSDDDELAQHEGFDLQHGVDVGVDVDVDGDDDLASLSWAGPQTPKTTTNSIIVTSTSLCLPTI